MLAQKTVGQWLLLALFGVVLYYCFLILKPFMMPIFLALILATLLFPVHEFFNHRFNGRRGLAALTVCIALTVAILLPVLFLSTSLATEANDVYQRLKDPQTLQHIEAWFDPTTNPVLRRFGRWWPSSFRLESLQVGAQAQKIGVATLGAAIKFATGVANFLMDYMIMIVVLFFSLRDANYFADRVRILSPLSDEEEKTFVDRLRMVTRATVLGNLTTSLSQGVIGGVIFLILGLPNPVLWGALTALLSLVPVVGTALVWVPWTIYLFASGAPVRAVIFVILQVMLVGGIDNILRPLFMRGGVNMHTLLIFFSILGGVTYFGILGIFLGPLIFAVATALLEFYFLPAKQHSP
jgi:predicted PurR-regulated permease PerM